MKILLNCINLAQILDFEDIDYNLNRLHYHSLTGVSPSIVYYIKNSELLWERMENITKNIENLRSTLNKEKIDKFLSHVQEHWYIVYGDIERKRLFYPSLYNWQKWSEIIIKAHNLSMKIEKSRK